MSFSNPLTIGYCTNIHAGTTLAAIQANLVEYSEAVRKNLGSSSLGVGLWIPQSAAQQTANDAIEFDKFLDARGLVPFTINGFPVDDFHGEIVKHSVYQPAWWEPRRFDYTIQVATILAEMLAHRYRDGNTKPVGSVSTLPLGWPPADANETEQLTQRCGESMRHLATQLQTLEKASGCRITVAIEPEPGCLIETSKQAIEFFETHLPGRVHRRYLSICHDVCHASVMGESQSAVMFDYAEAGIEIGKIQISNAIVAPWETMAIERRREAIDQLSQFAEDRYLHQTARRTNIGSLILEEDLPSLLARLPKHGDPVWNDRQWTVHFHVPIFLERFGHLTTTQDDIGAALSAISDPGLDLDFTGHIEVETYAWSVLPEPMRRRGLADELADELRWLNKKLIALSFD